jgi:hypothetical protein
MPGHPFQSKLIPHTEFIRESRASGMVYPRIAQELKARFGLQVSPSTIFSFVKVRARRRTVFTLPGPVRVAPHPPPTSTPSSPAGAREGWLAYDPAKPLEKDL